MKNVKVAFLFIFSIGWLAPLYLSFYFQSTWLNTEVAPMTFNRTPQMNSFPFLHDSQSLWRISFFWLCIVIVFWFCALLIIYGKMNKRLKELENK